MLKVSSRNTTLVSALAISFCIGCSTVIPSEPEEAETEIVAEEREACPMIKTENWAAWINAMPGPGSSGEKLIVTGDVTFSSGGHEVELIPGAADRSMRPMQQFTLSVKQPDGPATQAITTLQARYEGVAIAPQYRGITIFCDGEVIAEIDTVEKVY